MKNKIKKISTLTSGLALVALLVVPGINIALADHGGRGGGENNNRGRGNANSIVTPMVSASTGTGLTTGTNTATSTGTAVMNNKKGRSSNSEGDGEDNNNGNQGNLQARIAALEATVAQLDARILVLEQKAGVVDVTPPVISATASANVTTTTANITWTTNENSTSKVYFSTTTPVNLATATTVSDPALVMSHTLHLTGLTAGTMYHFVVESVDGSNNVSRGAELSFTTTAIDVTPPVISATAVTNITQTGSEIHWTTNEPGTSKVYFSTTTPVNLGTAATVSDGTLTLNHSLNLTGLTANTTFHFVVESKDASNNTSTSLEQSFVTLP